MKQTRFRASIYLDIFIDSTEEISHGVKMDGSEEIDIREKTLEEMREEAEIQVQRVVEEISGNDYIHCDAPDISNPYLGGVAKYDSRNLLKPLDREI